MSWTARFFLSKYSCKEEHLINKKVSNKSSGLRVQYKYHRLEERCIYLCIEEYIPLRIAELCQKRGYTKYRLAQLTGITQTALGNILNQKSMPTMANLERICDAFEVTIAQFFSEEGRRLNLTDEQKEILDIWDSMEEKEREIFMTFIRSMKK